ncbi:PTS sugar transporter subunit IIB [Streptococcus dentiloxodontae]
MITIMLACNAGMSTSMLVNKMINAAKTKFPDKEIMIFAVPTASVDKEVDDKQIDVILLGPQVKFLLNEFREKYEAKGIKVDVINMQDYGLMKGDNVLSSALELLGTSF